MGLRHWLQLGLTDGIGPVLTRRLIDAAGSAEQACHASLQLIQSIEGIGRKSSKIAQSLRQAQSKVDEELSRCAAAGVTVLCPDDPDYPILLRSIPDPPTVLYVRGTLEPRDLNALAIVGSRRCSFYGREQAERFAALLAASGFTVVSGGARGTDSAAHRGALSYPQGRTLAVLGCGADVAYPPENEALFRQIAQRGAIISEFPMGTPPLQEHFPRRNRIISGLSRGVLVIEADEKSGALITARQAVDDHNRPVFALPGKVDNPLSAGPHQLIRDGAILTAKLDDILDNLDPPPHAAVESTLFAETQAARPSEFLADANGPRPQLADPCRSDLVLGLTARQSLILLRMGSDAATVDAIMDCTALPPQVVLQELTFLTLKGMVQRIDGQTYLRKR